MALAVSQAIQYGDTAVVEQIISKALGSRSQDNKNFLHKLQAIISGERGLALADDENLHYELAAELVLLLGSLEEVT